MKKILLSALVLGFLSGNSSYGNLSYYQLPQKEDAEKVIEKVYLHVDRDIYYPGDDIWFKAYLIDALDNILTNHSRNLQVELISPFRNIILHRTIRLNDGLGNGDLKLPDNLIPGNYQIRTYTNYMRNYGDQLFFIKAITVVSDKEQIQIPDKPERLKNSIRLEFFPEGGSLIDNVTSVVAFKAVNNQEKGCLVSGVIYSSARDLITNFNSAHCGMGSFLLRPSPGLKYYAIYRGTDSIQRRAELPESFPKGITMAIRRNQENNLVITASTNTGTFPLVSESDMSLTLSIRNDILDVISFPIKSLITSLNIPANYLPSGVLKLTLTGPKNLPVSERLAYIENDTPLNVRIESDKRIYSKREPVSLRVHVSGDSILEKSNISLAAVNSDFLNKISLYQRSISSWFLLESDVRGVIEDPAYYFDRSEPDRLKNLDLLLLTQGWRDFAWKYDTAYFPPEDGFTISGILRKSNNKKLLEKSRISLGLFGNWNSFLGTIPVDSTGRFSISGAEITGEATLVVSGIDKKERINGLVTLDSINYIPAKVSDDQDEVIASDEMNLDSLKSYYSKNEVIKKKYKLSDTIPLGEVRIISERIDPQKIKVESSRTFYSKPDNELIITDALKSYPNVPELMRGKFPGVEVYGPTSGDPEYMIFIRGIGTINGSKTPLVLIDGMEADFKDIIRMPISAVDRIDVLKNVSSTSVYGFNGFNGVINLITKAGGRFADYAENYSTSRLKISGYNFPRIFYSPQHLSDSASAFKPDLRNTLFWEPNINLEGSKEVTLGYFNGDNASKVSVTCEGITLSGIPITGRVEYEVK